MKTTYLFPLQGRSGLQCHLGILLLLAALVLGSGLRAQTDEELDPDYCGRLSLSADAKLARGLHLAFEEEMRCNNGFASLDRLQSTLELKYKVVSGFKVGVGYTLISPYDGDMAAFKSPRHRLLADASYTVNLGNWSVALKERLQWTHRTGSMNTWQNPRDAWGLKSRLTLKYKGFGAFTPYAYVESRHFLNAYQVDAVYNGETGAWYTHDGAIKSDPGWFLDGRHCYMNRLRECIGFDYSFDKHNTLSVSLLTDQTTDLVIDANAEGTKLFSYKRQTGFAAWICVGYKFAL